MNIIKRNGSQASYEGDKIRIAITKANGTVPEEERLKRGDAGRRFVLEEKNNKAQAALILSFTNTNAQS